MRSSYDLSRVTQFGGIEPDGTTFDGRVTVLGSTPGRIHVKLYCWTADPRDVAADVEEPQMRWVEVDHLLDCTVTERQDGGIDVKGTSVKMMNEAKLDPIDSDVTWNVAWKPCPTCR